MKKKLWTLVLWLTALWIALCLPFAPACAEAQEAEDAFIDNTADESAAHGIGQLNAAGTVTASAEQGGTQLIGDISLRVAPPLIGQHRLSCDPEVVILEGAGFVLRSAYWLEEGGGFATIEEDYVFEEGKTYYRSLWLTAEEGYAFRSGAPASGNYETRFHLDGVCTIDGGDLYIAAVRGDAESGTDLTVVVMVKPEKGTEYSVLVTSNNKYMGTATASPSSGFTGTKVTLTPESSSSYRLGEWKVLKGGVTVAEDNTFIIGTEDVEIEAVFVDNTVGIALGATEGGSYRPVSELWGNVYEEQVYSMNISAVAGDRLTLLAKPAEGYTFLGWYEGVIGESYFVEDHTDVLISSEAEYTFTAAEYQVLCAVFAPRLPGDADVSGSVEAKDALAVLQYACGAQKEINLSNADVNGDGKADIQDARMILQHCCGWDVILK